MSTKLTEFFKSYKQAFDQFNSENIALHYKLPCIILDLNGFNSYNSLDRLVAKFSINCKSMKDMAYCGSELLMGEIKPLTTHTVSVDIGWRVKLATGPYDFRTLYLCHQENENWQIFSAVVYTGGLSENMKSIN
ncbi:MAG: hypothetical protein JKY19_07655 [Alcanivoracaceae bacterium]|nr:hypothetical protein [Alcanivoracaceae bacterium]